MADIQTGIPAKRRGRPPKVEKEQAEEPKAPKKVKRFKQVPMSEMDPYWRRVR